MNTDHGYVQHFQCLRFDGPKKSVKEDGVENGLEDITRRASVENLEVRDQILSGIIKICSYEVD